MTVPHYDSMLERLRDGFAALPDKPEETPESVLRALWCLAAGEPRSVASAAQADLHALDDAQLQQLGVYIDRYHDAVPLAHMTGRQCFYGLELLASPDALIPRRETEILAAAALDTIGRVAAVQPLVVDVCTGCGNLALLFAQHYPQARVFGADLTGEAVNLARRNAEFTGLADRVEFRQGDLLSPFDDGHFEARVDVLCCNPPYISSKKVPQMPSEIANFEPAAAFDGGPFGISILHRLIKEAVRYIKPGGYLVFELGLGQGPSMIKILERNADYSAVEGRADENGHIRAVVARVAERSEQDAAGTDRHD